MIHNVTIQHPQANRQSIRRTARYATQFWQPHQRAQPAAAAAAAANTASATTTAAAAPATAAR